MEWGVEKKKGEWWKQPGTTSFPRLWEGGISSVDKVSSGNWLTKSTASLYLRLHHIFFFNIISIFICYGLMDFVNSFNIAVFFCHICFL